jgi:magnesium and cobalt transporter
MGDTTDGSSSAAQSAQNDIQSTKRGFFARISEAFNPKRTPDVNQIAPPLPQAPVPGLLNLRKMRVEDVAIPKADIIAAPVTATKEELIALFREKGLTRLPIFDGTLDTPLGFVHMKDFALRYSFADGGPFDLKGLLRPLQYVPPSMSLGVLLQKMQAERIHMALVIDEYGGTDGLVTIEDLIEQVVGAIQDEHDIEEEKSWRQEKPGCYMVLAKTPLDAFETEVGMQLTAHEEIDDEEIETLGGLVFLLSGSVPVRGEVIQHPDGPEFEVVEADPRSIKRLRVRLPHLQNG